MRAGRTRNQGPSSARRRPAGRRAGAGGVRASATAVTESAPLPAPVGVFMVVKALYLVKGPRTPADLCEWETDRERPASAPSRVGARTARKDGTEARRWTRH